MSATPSIAREFDAKAPVYESNRLAPWYQAHADFLLEQVLPLGADDVVVDIGCGTGYLLRRLAAGGSGATGLGLDLSAGMIRVARSRADAAGARALTFVQADWEDPVARARALAAAPRPSRMICASTLHYFVDPAAALGAMVETLRPGGEVLILERASEHSPMTRIWGRLHRHLIRDHVQFYDSSTLVDMLRAAGFGQARVESRLRKRFWKGKLYTNLALIRATKPGVARSTCAAPAGSS